MSEYHRHAVEGGFIIHQAHDLGSGAAALDPIPFEGHRHLVVLMERNYVHEESGAATLPEAAEGRCLMPRHDSRAESERQGRSVRRIEIVEGPGENE